MFAPIHCVQQASYQIYHQLGFISLTQLLASEQVRRVKGLALSTFEKFSSFLTKFKSPSNEINLKPIAMVSCLLLIAILISSVFRHYTPKVPPHLG